MNMESGGVNEGDTLGTSMEVDIGTIKAIKVEKTETTMVEDSNTSENETTPTASIELPKIVKIETTDLLDFEKTEYVDIVEFETSSMDNKSTKVENCGVIENVKVEITNCLDIETAETVKVEILEIFETEAEPAPKGLIPNRPNAKGNKTNSKRKVTKKTKTGRTSKDKSEVTIANKPKTTIRRTEPGAGESGNNLKTSGYKLRIRTKQGPKSSLNPNEPGGRTVQNKPKTKANEKNVKSTKTNQTKSKTNAQSKPKRSTNRNKPETATRNTPDVVKLDTDTPETTMAKEYVHDSTELKSNENESETTAEIEKKMAENRPLSKRERRKKQTYECRTCKQICGTRWDLEKHKNNMHRTYVGVKCDVCGKTDFESYGAYYYHIRLHTSRFKCEYCAAPFMSRTTLTAHGAAREIYEKCPHCDEMFFRKCVLRMHMKTVHAGNEEPCREFPCSECNKRFTSLFHKSRHVMRVHKTKKVECTECGKQVMDLSHHIKKWHCRIEKTDSKPSTVSDIQNHMYLPNKMIQCDLCGKVLKHKWSYLEHRATHMATALFLCEFCGKTFNKRSNLRTHLFSHTGDRPYKCTYCPKGLLTPEDLTRHIRTHTGEKPYKCELCGRAFAQKGAVSLHKKKKHIKA